MVWVRAARERRLVGNEVLNWRLVYDLWVSWFILIEVAFYVYIWMMVSRQKFLAFMFAMQCVYGSMMCTEEVYVRYVH